MNSLYKLYLTTTYKKFHRSNAGSLFSFSEQHFANVIFLVRLSGVENYNLIHVYIEKLKKL